MANLTYTRNPDYVPGTIISGDPCVLCLNDKEQWAILAILMYIAAKATVPSDANTILSESGCVKCFNKHELMGLAINCLANYIQDAGYATAQQVTDLRACMNCTDTAILQGIVAEWWCVFLARVTPQV